MKFIKIALISMLVFSYCGCATEPEKVAPRPSAPPLAIKGGLLIDGTGKAPIPNSVVVIEGGTIKAVGAAGNVTIPPRAHIIEADNRIVLPGLIDMHVHYRDWMDPLFLSHGVTTVRDVGNNLEYILQARKRSHIEGARKPRIYTSGAFLDGSPPVFGEDLSFVVTTPQEAKAAASKLVASNVDCLKTQQKITLPLLQAITEVAQREHVPVVVHLGDSKMGNIKASDAILLGVKNIEHGSGINFITVSQSELEAISDMIVAHSIYVTPTLFMEEQFSRLLDPELKKDPLLKQTPPYVFKFWETTFGVNTWWTERNSSLHRAILKKRMQFVGILIKKGGLIVAGTDTPVPYVFPGESLHRELELLVSAGLTPMQAVMAATKTAAELLGHADRFGTLQAGRSADIQLLGANPLENISNVRSVEMVFRDGKMMWKK